MQWFYNFKLRTKLLAGFILVAVMAVAIGYIGIKKIHEIDDADTRLYEKMTVPLALTPTFHTPIGPRATNYFALKEAVVQL